jgi:pyruvate formate lyase activating enzyme
MWNENKCLHCQDCVSVCDLICFDKNRLNIKKAECNMCGKCFELCVTKSLKAVGRGYTQNELIKTALKDKVFYDVSKGGVTFSGGEPLSYPKFIGGVAEELKNHGISTAIETCGYFDFDKFEHFVLLYIDSIMFDLKFIDSDKHKQFTGVSNELIIENFKKLTKKNILLIPRTPLIPDITDIAENLTQIKNFLQQFDKVYPHILLPYNYDVNKNNYLM